MKNNLFYYTTSELSQDAFICWLVSFADEAVSRDAVLTECAKEFLAMLALMARYIDNTQNAIFGDYYEYWNNFNKETQRFRELPLSQWGWKHINGFYSQLSESGFFTQKDL